MTPVTTQQVNRQTALDSSATTAKKDEIMHGKQ